MTRPSLEERVLAYLKEHPGSSPREIADALGEPVSRIRRVLGRLRDRGLVARGEEGKYYAVAIAVKGIAPRELRRRVSHELEPDLEALQALIEELIARLDSLERRVKRLEVRLEEECGREAYS